jgi:MFS family permease
MLSVFRDSWTLLLGLLLLMLGNGLQGTLLGVRGALEGMTPGALSVVMSAYFLGLLIGARVTPLMIRRVGHVRVFAALASMISAGFILYAALPDPWVWAATRLVVGFCFCGVYIVAESWLNERATNETRGQAMSAYMLVQMVGIVSAQGLMTLADPGGYALFVLISVLVSLSVTPMLLSVSPAPAFDAAKRMSLRRLMQVSPLGCVGVFLLGGVFSAMFGMAAVYGALAGLTVPQISALVAAMYAGGLVTQWPMGWLSDRIDRRRLIVGLCLAGFAASGLAALGPGYPLLLLLAAVVGGSVNPLYSVLIAHTNDFLEPSDMASASGGLLFLNGVGAVGGPLAVGLLMDRFGPGAFFLQMGGLMGLIALYGLWRMTRRPAKPAVETGAHIAVLPSASPVAVEIATGIAAEISADLAADGQPADAEERPRAETA